MYFNGRSWERKPYSRGIVEPQMGSTMKIPRSFINDPACVEEDASQIVHFPSECGKERTLPFPIPTRMKGDVVANLDR